MLFSDPCVYQIFWKDHALVGVHFFDYPVGYVFENDEELPDRSGRGRTIRLAFTGMPPEIRADTSGVHYLYLEENAEIIVTPHPDLLSLSFTVEVYGAFEAPTTAVFILNNRGMKFPAYSNDAARDIYAKLTLSTAMTEDLSANANNVDGHLEYLVFSYNLNTLRGSIFVDAAETANEVVGSLFTTDSENIVIGNDNGVHTRGALYFARLLDIPESPENITMTYDCEYFKTVVQSLVISNNLIFNGQCLLFW